MPVRPWILPAALLLCVAASLSAAGEAADAKPLTVLVLAPAGAAHKARGVRDLLAAHGVRARIEDPAAGEAKAPEDCRLVLVLGAGRDGPLPDPAWTEGRPVLGLGSAGCLFFGRLRLKNGHPHT